MITLYGIHNCDTVKKAQKFLAQRSVKYTFIDFRKNPISEELLQHFVDICGVETLVNKRSKTYRELTEEQKNNITTDVILQNITLIKRPVLTVDAAILIGFDEQEYVTALQL